MTGKPKLIILLAVAFIIANGAFYSVFADHDEYEHKEKKHHYEKEGRGHDDDDDRGKRSPVTNSTYNENCGSCHLAYPPDLLPSRSWNRILSEIEAHFGEKVAIGPDATPKISEYLKKNAADVSSSEVSRKIMKDITLQTPSRITEIPYIIKKHHGVMPSVLKRSAIGSLSNYVACHAGAGKGDFDDDGVVIPN